MNTLVDNAPLAFGDDDARRNLDAVRDLLFGSRNREIERRLGQLEDRLNASVAALEDRLNRQFADLEQGIRREIGATQEQFEQKGAAAGAEVRQLGDLLNKRFTNVEDSLSRVENENCRLILERAKALKDEMNDALKDLGGQVAHLKQSSASRGDLSRRLMDLGRLFSEEPGTASLENHTA